MSKSFSSALQVVWGILLWFLFLQNIAFAQAVNSEWTDISLSGTDAFSIDAEYRYKVSSQWDFWFYPKEISARSLVSNESYFGQIFYVSADAKTSYQYNGNFLGTVVQIQKRTLPSWTDVSLTGIDPFDVAYEYRFKMTVPGRPGVPAWDFWYYAKQVGTQSLVMDNGYGEITFVSAANKTAYLSRGTPTGIIISQMQRRALTWDDVPLNNTEVFDVSCNYRFKMNYPASPQWRPGVPAWDFWHYPERSSAQSHIANANGGYQTFSVFANNKTVFDFNGINNGAVLQMQKQCFVPPPTLCSEGQYFCTAENICKPAGQPCNTLCTVGTAVKWVDFSNLYTATGNNWTVQMGWGNVLVNYTGQINYFGLTDQSQWFVIQGNPALFPNGVADNVPDQTDIISTWGGNQTLHKVTFSKPVKDPVMVIYSIGWNRVEYQFDQPFTILKKTADVNKLANNTVEWSGGSVLIQFQWTYSELSFKVPILEMMHTLWFSGFNFGIPDVQSCPSVTCNNNNTCETGESCNCADCTNGGGDDKDQCGMTSTWAQMVCTKDKDSSVMLPLPTVNPNLIINGDFEQWNTGFTSQYTYSTSIMSEGTYAIWSTVRNIHASLPNCTDHTGTGKFMGVNSGGSTTNNIYCQQVNVEQNTNYSLSAWVSFIGIPAAALDFSINGQNIGSSLVLTNTDTCAWSQFSNQWNSGTNTTANICLKNKNTGVSGNDFSLDDIVFRKVDTATSSAQVGACCPAGKQWSSVQSACVSWDQCTPVVTLKKGSELTTVTNTAGEAFSTNGACANKQISLSPCHFTTGAISDGTSPSGNPLYRWPKEASGLSRDYNLVEIKGQCWFADNLQENSSVWPSPVDIWENTAPHNGYGLYSYAGTGVNRPEGYLYQFDAATNNPTPGGGPAGSLQWVCPAGWHVATDCEFQYVEHALGMTVAEQQTIWHRGSGNVGTALKADGTSGFDLPLSGARRYNTGFINGGSEGHLWSTDCDPSAWPAGGCYKRIFNISNWYIYRIKGDGGTYDSSHHAAGSVRCVKDGTETPTTCPVAKCAEGQYYCHAELKCKPANETCGTVTCNNNGTCDLNESCDCADCNEKADHCGINANNEQLICTKDTAEKCYTDKFPYCLSACLDGYKMDTNGQCVLDTSSFVAPTCTNRSVNGTTTAIATCQTNEVLTGGGCSNTSGGAYFLGGFPIKQGESWTTYTPTYDPGYWHSYEYPAGPSGPTTATGNGFACATGYSATYVRATAVCCENTSVNTTVIRTGTIGDSKSLAQCNIGEVRVWGGCRYISGGSYFWAGHPLNAGETYSALTATQDGFVCVWGVGTMIEARAVCKPAKTGETVKVIKWPVNWVATCDDGYVVTGGGCESIGGAYYYIGNVIKAWQGDAYTSLNPTHDGFVCASGSSYANSQPYAICVSPSKPSWTSVGSTATSSITYFWGMYSFGYNNPATGGQSCPTWYTAALISGTENLDYNLYICTRKSSDTSTPLPTQYFDFGGMYGSGGTPNSWTLQNNPLTGAKTCPVGYTSAQILWTANLDFPLYYCWKSRVTPPTLASEDFWGVWGMRTTTVWVWSGTEYNNPVTNTPSCSAWFNPILAWGTDNVDWLVKWCHNTKVTTPSVSQLWACCPPWSAWNSLENRCIPTTCGEGQFYCAAQKKCLAGGTTCDTTVCNNDGVCSGEESCQCADCVNGGGDDRDKCSVIGGVQAMCSDDNLADGKPGACCIPPKKWNSTTNTCVECSNTQAPSELKAGVDEPYITCTGGGDSTKTHFRYRITKQWVTEAPFISDMYTIGTQVLHPTMTLGDYTVECFYGNSTGVDASAVAIPHSCVKTMSVKSDAQGCSRVYPYKGSTLSDEMTSTFAFDASFRCGSRKPIVGTITNPYMFRVGTQPISYLSFDSLISELFNGLTIGPVSNQTQSYNFDTGTTDVTCATKVGGWYSTNNACRLTTCAGGNCNTPQTFSVVHSDDLTCTTEDTSTYNIGCNPAAPDSVRNQCIQWFRDAITAGSRNVTNGVEFDVSFVFNADAPTNVKCIKYVAGQMPGGLNLSDNVVCSAPLNNGERYQIYAADTNGRIDALQTTAKTVERDRDDPTIAEIKYYTDDTLTTEVPTTNWYNKPVVALAVCSDTPLNEATSCACSKTVDPATTDAAFWSVGVPNSLIGADLMRYTRTITESTTGTQKVLVMDTAGNKSQEKNIAVSLDTQAPIVALVESGTGVTKTVTLTATDTGSKIWKTTTAPSGATNTNGIVYRVGPKEDMQTLAFDVECNATSSFATVADTKVAWFPSQALATVSVNTATHVVAYCVRDNAGNTARGIYPVTTNACFSSSNMATIPTLDTYKDLLKTRLSGAGNDNQKYGYSFSENTTDANCFRGILANNVTTLMANQLKAKNATTLSNWDTDRSQLNTSTTLSNGYYYYVYPTSNTLDIVTSPTSSGAPVKTVVVDGGDIRIKTDLIYSGEGKTLLIVARKNTNGQGGNIIIDTNVKRIDAILIADGGALKSSDATLPGERLIINGRVYSYNTRGGSLSASGVDLIDAVVPKRFANASLVNASSLNDARVQDLERFRPMFADGSSTCSMAVNYTAFTTTNLPAILKRPSTYTGGSCGF